MVALSVAEAWRYGVRAVLQSLQPSLRADSGRRIYPAENRTPLFTNFRDSTLVSVLQSACTRTQFLRVLPADCDGKEAPAERKAPEPPVRWAVFGGVLGIAHVYGDCGRSSLVSRALGR